MASVGCSHGSPLAKYNAPLSTLAIWSKGHGNDGRLVGQRGAVSAAGVQHGVHEELGSSPSLSNSQQAPVETPSQEAPAIGHAHAVGHLFTKLPAIAFLKAEPNPFCCSQHLHC